MDLIIPLGIGVIVVFFVILILSNTSKKSDGKWKTKVNSELSKLSKSFNSNDQIVLKNTLIEMDKLLNFTLKSRKFSGNTLGERLKSSKKSFDWNIYQSIWEAHKKRNQLVHEVGVNINKDEIKVHIQSLNSGIRIMLK